jgi:hypothetical protein
MSIYKQEHVNLQAVNCVGLNVHTVHLHVRIRIPT